MYFSLDSLFEFEGEKNREVSKAIRSKLKKFQAPTLKVHELKKYIKSDRRKGEEEKGEERMRKKSR